MKLIITTETHYVIGKDGRAYCPTGTRGYTFWQRYLDVFDTVTVVGRVSTRQGPATVAVEGPGVSLAPLPDYAGPVEYLRHLPELKRRARQACREEACVILHAGPVGSLIWETIRSERRPYGIEVVGDPYEVFAPDGVKHPLRTFFRWWIPRQLRQQCRDAAAACYVTERILQRRYPPGAETCSVHCSDVHLPRAAFVPSPRVVRDGAGSFQLVTVGSLAQLYKAPDILIDAVALCVRQGVDAELTFVGDGRYRPELEARAQQVGLEGRVQFLGQLPAGEQVRTQLDRADLFVLPSRTEGLPRALVEAMARALPCIGSTVGGFPELLPLEDLIPPGDATALAAKIREVLSSPVRMTAMSERNLAKACDYREEALYTRRLGFYRHVKDRTEGWLETANPWTRGE